jgi:hypothetical protein
MSEVREFAERLNRLLIERYVPSSCNSYVHVAGLMACIREAGTPSAPLDDEYPRMLYKLYKNGDRHETRVVASADEEALAVAEGYGRGAPPLHEKGFPKAMIERPFDRGGTKRSDFRRVTLFAEKDEKLFKALVDTSDWVADDRQHGGRGIGLDTLIAERKELLKQIVDQEQLTLGSEVK